jgi:hypothetical protein
MSLVAGANRFGTTSDSPQLAPFRHRIDVPPQRGVGGLEHFDQVGNAHNRSFPNDLQNQFLTLSLQHTWIVHDNDQS